MPGKRVRLCRSLDRNTHVDLALHLGWMFQVHNPEGSSNSDCGPGSSLAACLVRREATDLMRQNLLKLRLFSAVKRSLLLYVPSMKLYSCDPETQTTCDLARL